VERLTDSFTGF